MSEFRVVICGGGIAAVEGLLRLRSLAGDSVQVEMIAPNLELVYRPLAVREPFAFGPARRYPLRRIATDTRSTWIQDALGWVDPDSRSVHTREGRQVEYDALLVAVGAKQMEAFQHVATFRDSAADATYQGIVQDVEEGYSRSLAYLQPDGPVWPLPLYELALMTARRAESMDIRGLKMTLVTPESQPLGIFGKAVSEVVSNRLARAGIEVYTDSHARVPAPREVVIEPSGTRLSPERTIAMPRIVGPSIRGLPGSSSHGFLPVDKHCAVPNTGGRVFAAGDVVNYPIKHGGIGSQMADCAAAAIAAMAGAQVEAPAFDPVVRGMLLTGAEPVFMSARPVGGESFESEVFDTPPWPADAKVIAEELGPYLAGLDSSPTTTSGRSG